MKYFSGSNLIKPSPEGSQKCLNIRSPNMNGGINTNDSKPILFYMLESLHLEANIKYGKSDDSETLAEYKQKIHDCYASHPLDENQHPPTKRQLYYAYGLWKKLGKPDNFSFIYKYVIWKKPSDPIGHLDIANIIDYFKDMVADMNNPYIGSNKIKPNPK